MAVVDAALPRPLEHRGVLAALPSTLVLALASLAGLFAFLYPFLLSQAPTQDNQWEAHTNDAPLVFGVVAGLSLLLLLLELTRNGMNAKTASTLAVLVMASAALRLPTLPVGATAFFFLVILGGYVFGPRFGFLLGATGIFVSAFALGGFGPWVPFQMLVSGWVGLTAGWFSTIVPRALPRRGEIALLVVFGLLWGFLYGAIMNLYFWPFLVSGESVSWRPGMGLGESLRHYWSFYLLTSAGWDAWRAAANAVLIVALGQPVLALLVRFRDRFQVEIG